MHNLTAAQMDRIRAIFARSGVVGQGNPAVATYIDGVPQIDGSSTNQRLLDVESIEFLRGPQGTLYGRNSIAGLVHIKTKRPSTTTSEVRADLTFGNYDLREFTLGYSAPLISEKLAFSISGVKLDRTLIV